MATLKPWLVALGLSGLAAASAHAAWDATLIMSGSADGARVGVVSFNGIPVATHIGALGDDHFQVTATGLTAGTWRSFEALSGGNSATVSLSHAAAVQLTQSGSPGVDLRANARLTVNTGTTIDRLAITTPTSLSAAAIATSGLRQDFNIAPVVAGTEGKPVFVTLSAWFDHGLDLDGSFAGTAGAGFASSSFDVYLNGVRIDRDATGWGRGGDAIPTFTAYIGDTVSVRLSNTTQFIPVNLSLGAGALGFASTFGEAVMALQISPVPEPEAWAMLAAGLGLIGWRLRRRQAVRQPAGAA
jgi:hypothetical protein